MTVTYQFEPLAELVKEPAAAELIREHFEQAGAHKEAIPLNIDFPKLLEYARAGIFRVVTARDDGEFLGYMAWWLYPHLIYVDTPRAIQGPWNLLQLLRPSVTFLKEMGIRCVVAHVSLATPDAQLIIQAHKHMEFEETSLVLTRVL